MKFAYSSRNSALYVDNMLPCVVAGNTCVRFLLQGKMAISFIHTVESELRWVVAWSRIFADCEYLCAINTDASQSLAILATVDNSLNPPYGRQMTCLLSTDSTHKARNWTSN